MGGAGRAHTPNNFENSRATSPALIRCIVLYCFIALFSIAFKNNCPPPILQLLRQQLLVRSCRFWNSPPPPRKFAWRTFALTFCQCFAFRPILFRISVTFALHLRSIFVLHFSLFRILDKSFHILVNSVPCFVPGFVSCFVPCSAFQLEPR